MPRPPRSLVVAAFAAVYLVWGSTYLAMRIALEAMPPFAVGAVRFLAAGIPLYLVLRLRGAARPTPREWRSATIVGTLLFLGGNGGVLWSELYAPSGVVALLVGMVPLWLMLIGWWRGVAVPRALDFFGVALGLAGVALLVHPDGGRGAGGVNLVGAGIMVVSTLAWSVGTFVARAAPMPAVPLLGGAMEMVTGGAALALAAQLHGEWATIAWTSIPASAWWSLAYLAVFGSLVAFTAYRWLLGVTTSAMVGTYAFVNPIVAVALGSWFAAEPFGRRELAAMLVIVGAVALLTRPGARAVPAEPAE
ncbi:MAG: EamA family transporter [Gemmatimonadaceae bacterium]|nr:EamA family transporter [Gemmatimonadaceae bacterium]